MRDHRHLWRRPWQIRKENFRKNLLNLIILCLLSKQYSVQEFSSGNLRHWTFPNFTQNFGCSHNTIARIYIYIYIIIKAPTLKCKLDGWWLISHPTESSVWTVTVCWSCCKCERHWRSERSVQPFALCTMTKTARNLEKIVISIGTHRQQDDNSRSSRCWTQLQQKSNAISDLHKKINFTTI